MKKIIASFVIIFSLLATTVFASAAVDPAVTIVNPVHKSELYTNSLLISIKVTQPKNIKVKVYEEKQTVNGALVPILAEDWKKADGKLKPTSVEYMPAEAFCCSNSLSFYTKQLNDVKSGTYRVQVDTVNGDGKVTYTANSLVLVSDKDATANIFDTPQSGTMQFLQNLLKSIFGDN